MIEMTAADTATSPDRIVGVNNYNNTANVLYVAANASNLNAQELVPTVRAGISSLPWAVNHSEAIIAENSN